MGGIISVIAAILKIPAIPKIKCNIINIIVINETKQFKFIRYKFEELNLFDYFKNMKKNKIQIKREDILLNE